MRFILGRRGTDGPWRFFVRPVLGLENAENGLTDGRSGHSIEVEASLHFFRSVH
ncbi:hypothetical protein B4113_0106 [Geobacillus sp. B4113_201601]|nr:hypothetical protein B4113_0106 [Geobacillus sp. B4113_201601]